MRRHDTQMSFSLFISTHTSRVGCDLHFRNKPGKNHISTHTSRVGCDCIRIFRIVQKKHFYSHIPCGMRPVLSGTESKCSDFYSHIPCGMRRDYCFLRDIVVRISTHTSRVGCDSFRPAVLRILFHFYSHIPCGMRLYIQDELFAFANFYSHIPCGMRPLYIVYFNHIIPIYYRMDL